MAICPHACKLYAVWLSDPTVACACFICEFLSSKVAAEVAKLHGEYCEKVCNLPTSGLFGLAHSNDLQYVMFRHSAIHEVPTKTSLATDIFHLKGSCPSWIFPYRLMQLVFYSFISVHKMVVAFCVAVIIILRKKGSHEHSSWFCDINVKPMERFSANKLSFKCSANWDLNTPHRIKRSDETYLHSDLLNAHRCFSFTFAFFLSSMLRALPL